MEIQPPSSVAEATANYTGWTNEQVDNAIRRIWPYRAINTLKNSLDTQAAVSSTGLSTEYREAERIEGYRMLHGIVENPWSSIHEVEIGKMDPYYMSLPSQNLTDLYQNTIGKPTGVPEVGDPRLIFTENLLKLKEFQRGMDNEFSHSYLQNLFSTQLDNGRTYYQNQAKKQQQAFSDHMMKKLSQVTAPDDHEHRKQTQITQGIVKAYPDKRRNFDVHTHGIYQHNPKRAKLDQLHKRFTQKLPKSEEVSFTHHPHPHPIEHTPFSESTGPPGPYVETSTISHTPSTELSLVPSKSRHNPQSRIPSSDMQPRFVPLIEDEKFAPIDYVVSTQESTNEEKYAAFIENFLQSRNIDSIGELRGNRYKYFTTKAENMKNKLKLTNKQDADIWNKYVKRPGSMETPNTITASDSFQLGNQSRYVK